MCLCLGLKLNVCVVIPTLLPQPTLFFALPKDSYKGPKLEAGEDYSKDRKNDYEAETTNGYVLAPVVQLFQVVTYMSPVEEVAARIKIFDWWKLCLNA